MANDLEERVDKLSEAVGVLGERVAQVEHEQGAMHSSIDQLTGEVRQIDKWVIFAGAMGKIGEF